MLIASGLFLILSCKDDPALRDRIHQALQEFTKHGSAQPFAHLSISFLLQTQINQSQNAEVKRQVQAALISTRVAQEAELEVLSVVDGNFSCARCLCYCPLIASFADRQPCCRV